MTSEAIRDPKTDHLLTPQNAAFIIIDYQPVQVNSIASIDRQLLLNNITGCAKAAVAYGLPIVHSTVNVETGLNKPPVPQVRKALANIPVITTASVLQGPNGPLIPEFTKMRRTPNMSRARAKSTRGTIPISSRQ